MTVDADTAIRLANALRGVIERLADGTLTAGQAEELGQHLEAVAPGAAPTVEPPGRDIDWTKPYMNRLLTGPLVGLGNPLAPPVRYDFEPPATSGSARVTFGVAHAGSHGFVHGGWVAAVFDEMLGGLQTAAGHRGMTGSLTIRYRQPTPVKRELTFTAHIHNIQGRKAMASAKLWDGEALLAEAEAVFVQPRQAESAAE